MKNFLVGTWSANSSGIFTELSTSARQILDLEPNSSLTFDDYVSMVCEEERQAYLVARQQAYQSGQVNIEYRVIVNGKVKWIREVSMLDTPSESTQSQGNVALLRTFIQDITELSYDENCAHPKMKVSNDIVSSLLTISEEERKKVAEAFHDDISQRLAAVSITLASTNDGESSSDYNQIISRIRSELATASDEIHKLSRQLYPSIVEHFGLIEALRSEIENFQRRERIDIKFTSSIDSVVLERKIELAIFRIAQELLNNIARHSEAYLVSINIMQTDNSLLIQITDNGMGFDVAQKLEEPGHGLISIQARANYINARLSIVSEEFQGTKVELLVPLSREQNSTST